WETFLEKFPVGSVVEGEIKNITEFGLFIGLTNDIDGMCHLSDLSWTTPGEKAIAEHKKGQVVKAKILDVDTVKERVSLGIKQLVEGERSEAATTTKLKKGDVVTCTITAVTDGGIEVTVTGGAPGFIRKAELSRDRSEQRPGRFAPGEKVDAKVTQVDAKSHRLSLSIKALEVEEEKKAMAEYGSSDSGASLGDILGAAIQKAKAAAKVASEGEPADDAKPKKAKKAKKSEDEASKSDQDD
ncbi:MAG: S1 RNA-binding domain-containing protein, partial [Pseudomonadota bacterium]